MPFAAALSRHPDPTEATGEVVGEVIDRIGSAPDLAVLFCSPDLVEPLGEIVDAARHLLAPHSMLGASAVAVVGGAHEVEDGPALSLWAARLPDAPRPLRITAIQTPSGSAVQGLSVRELPPGGTLLLLADPFSLPTDDILDAVAASETGVRVVGGFASSADGPGGNRLVLDGEIHSDGGVAVVLPGDVTTLVSQGCRPIGAPMIVTRSEHHIIFEIAGRPAIGQLEAVASRLTPDEREQLARGLHLGVVVDEHKASFERGDFLVRNVIAADRESGALAVGGDVPIGTTVQFQVRDAAAADDDLRAALADVDADGALVFTCNGRGRRLFGVPDHDAEIVSAALDGGAVAGMFCAGEIGPVGSRSFVHGFTASLALFADRR